MAKPFFVEQVKLKAHANGVIDLQVFSIGGRDFTFSLVPGGAEKLANFIHPRKQGQADLVLQTAPENPEDAFQTVERVALPHRSGQMTGAREEHHASAEIETTPQLGTIQVLSSPDLGLAVLRVCDKAGNLAKHPLERKGIRNLIGLLEKADEALSS